MPGKKQAFSAELIGTNFNCLVRDHVHSFALCLSIRRIILAPLLIRSHH